MRARIGPGTRGPLRRRTTGARSAPGPGACSRALDYLQTDPDVDGRRVAVIGHSRLGKTALWAGAQDERFAMVVSNDSGEGGAALARRKFGETHRGHHARASRTGSAAATASTTGARKRCPSTSTSCSRSSPRGRSTWRAPTEDLWADPRGEFLAAQAAEPVYRLLGTDGLGVEEMPAPDRPVGDSIGYHLRRGDARAHRLRLGAVPRLRRPPPAARSEGVALRWPGAPSSSS